MVCAWLECNIYAVISLSLLEEDDDVAKMRQAGTAPATGTTIYCLSSLWCTVTYKRCSVMDAANTLLRANVRLALRSDLCLPDLLCYLSMDAFGIRSFRSKCVTLSVRGVASPCVTVEVRFVSNVT